MNIIPCPVADPKSPCPVAGFISTCPVTGPKSPCPVTGPRSPCPVAGPKSPCPVAGFISTCPTEYLRTLSWSSSSSFPILSSSISVASSSSAAESPLSSLASSAFRDPWRGARCPSSVVACEEEEEEEEGRREEAVTSSNCSLNSFAWLRSNTDVLRSVKVGRPGRPIWAQAICRCRTMFFTGPPPLVTNTL
ncbi:hypothetical protein EYF80_043074 [Liparis tanakae]|uniref:Uncharacterized protein n=1 Tax=Liparis tanakae TaxID=230148 RepID=A0A4Z2G0S1_9TELE|nr:hypothetical protein EYF80_043074 [Liparis tanakae]